MIRKILAALLVGAAVVALNRPDEVREAARDAIDGAIGEATERVGGAVAERCRDDPASCLD